LRAGKIYWGHTSTRITTDYSVAEFGSLINGYEKVCGEEGLKKPSLVLMDKVA